MSIAAESSSAPAIVYSPAAIEEASGRQTGIGSILDQFTGGGQNAGAVLSQFDNITATLGNGARLVLSKSGDTYVDQKTGAIQTTDTIDNAPQTPASFAQAAAVAGGQPAFVLGNAVNAGSSVSSSGISTTEIIVIAGILGLVGLIILRRS